MTDWQPIETAPRRKYIQVWAWSEYPTTAICWTDEPNVWNLTGWQTNGPRDNDGALWFEPTHWMPLPEPPTTATEAKEPPRP